MDLRQPVSLGTTIVGLVYDGGVILGADTRRSLGMYVSNRTADKLTVLADNVCMAQAGTAAHSELLVTNVKQLLERHHLQLNDQVSVKTAANLLHQLVYRNKDALNVGAIIGGYDKYQGASLYESTLGGSLIKTTFALSGSGSTYIYGWFDKYWRENMSAEEAREFTIRAVTHAMARDASSGGCIRILMINDVGIHREFIPADKIPGTYSDLA